MENKNKTLNLNSMMGSIIGSAVGDALGVPVEFMSRDELKRSPVGNMRGFGTYPVPEGTWSDDTSLSIATLDSLSGGRFSPEDMMSRFAMWLKGAEYTATGSVFDVGGTTAAAIEKYCRGDYNDVTECGRKDEYSSGNGALMRIHPVVLYALEREIKPDDALKLVEEATSLTHGSKTCLFASCAYYFLAFTIVRMGERINESTLYSVSEIMREIFDPGDELDKICAALYPLPKSEDEVKSSGYVVDSLGAAVWALATTDSFESAVLRAVNLGEDTDTVAAITGSLAGMIYGYSAIPKDWLATLKSTWYIERMCDNAFAAWRAQKRTKTP